MTHPKKLSIFWLIVTIISKRDLKFTCISFICVDLSGVTQNPIKRVIAGALQSVQLVSRTI